MQRSVSFFVPWCLLLVAGLVTGRAPLSIRETIIIERNAPGYLIEDIIVEEPTPIVKSTESREETTEENEIYEIEDVIVEEPAPLVKSTETQEEIYDNSTENTIPQARVFYNGSQLWKVYIDSITKIEVLAKLRDEKDISMWGGNNTSIDILVKPGSLEKVRSILDKRNIKHEILIEDLQKAIDEENPPREEENEDRRGHRLTWQSYHRLDDIYGYLDYLAKNHPESCSVKVIGNSVQGRPIKLLKISNGRPGNKAIWVDGGIHAREWISPATVTYIINEIVLNYDTQPKHVQNIDWYIAPLLNPDGYEYSHSIDRLWRKNRARAGTCAGTDLNRNFGYRWGGQGSSRNPCAETYGGSGAFSEPETASVQRFITGTPAQWRAYISFHSYGQYILYPWGYNRVVPPDHKDLEMVGRQAAAAIRSATGSSYRVGPAAHTLYPAAGGSDDWAKGSAGIKYAYTIELRDNGRYGFVLPANYIGPTAKESLAAVSVIAQAAGKV